MNRSERSAQTTSPKTGPLAVLARSLRGNGTGAPSIRLLATLALALAALVLVAVPAASAAPYRYEAAQSEALSAGVPGGAFEEPAGLTFDSSGNLYAVDRRGNAGKAIIDKFNSENQFQAQIGSEAFTEAFVRNVAVNDETGHIYSGFSPIVSESPFSDVFVFDAAGELLSKWNGANSPAENFGDGCCVPQTAVDNSPSPLHGDVYVVTTQGGGRIDVFEPQNGDSEEAKFIRELQPPEGGFALNNPLGLAVNQANGDLYVAELEGNKAVDQYSPTGELIAQIKGPSPGKHFTEPTAVGVNGVNGHVFVADHIPGSATIYEFDAAGNLVNQISEAKANEPLELPAGIAVQETGPHAGELYVADAETKSIDVFAEQQPGPPLIAAEGVQDLIGSRATFLGEINPTGSLTQYRFEYGACSSAGTCAISPYGSIVPLPDASLGFEDFTSHPTASVPVSGLAPTTTYHFRLVAHNASGEAFGDERVFTTQGPAIASQLPDGRQWQLVTPPDKHGGSVEGAGERGLALAAADGSAVTYLDSAPIESSPPGFIAGGQALSVREAAGWSSRDLGTSPRRRATGGTPGAPPPYRLFDEGLTAAVLQPLGLFEPSLSAEASEQTPYLQQLRSCSTRCFSPLVTGEEGFANVPAGTHFGEELLCEENNPSPAVTGICGPVLEGGTGDARHLLLRSGTALVPDAPANELYEWSAGQLSLVSILPPNEAGEELPTPTSVGDVPFLGAAIPSAEGTTRRAISADGSRIYWNDGANLYLRDMTKGKTLQIDAPEAGCPLGSGEGECEAGGGHFQIASIDGSRVYFTDTRHLTADSGGSQFPVSPDLYECRIGEAAGRPTCALRDLTPLEGGQSADVQGNVLGASEDGSAIYFVADGTLSGAGSQRGACVNNGENAPQAPGATCNLYLLEDGSAPRLVASLSGADAQDWTRRPQFQPVRVSPNGRYLAFMSGARPTGYDNTDVLSGEPDAEVYLYDTGGAGALICASCEPSGARPRGVEYAKLTSGTSQALRAVRGEWESDGWVSALLPKTMVSANSLTRQPRYLSDSGRLYFNSLDALVPQDSNATGDVYQYEPPGVGSCSATSSTFVARSRGCIDLISSGTSPEASYFLDASESGDDAFFFTASRLTSSDVDSRRDVYDAHVCSNAVPCFPPPPPATPACEGDACQQPATPPIDPTPASLAFNGAGNLTECPKGQKLSKDNCVRQKSKKKHHKKSHDKKKGHKKQKRSGSDRGGAR